MILRAVADVAAPSPACRAEQVRRDALGGTVRAVTVRGLSAVLGVALIAAGCGGSGTPARGAAIHLDGKRAQGDYVFETGASGARFLVPAPVLAAQGGQVFDVGAPTGAATAGEPTNTITTAPPAYRAVVASATAVVPHAAHVEVLATGEPGRRSRLAGGDVWLDPEGAVRGWRHRRAGDRDSAQPSGDAGEVATD